MGERANIWRQSESDGEAVKDNDIERNKRLHSIDKQWWSETPIAGTGWKWEGGEGGWRDERKHEHEGSHADTRSHISVVISGDIYLCPLALLVVSAASRENSIICVPQPSSLLSVHFCVHPSTHPARHSNVHPGMTRSDSAGKWVKW